MSQAQGVRPVTWVLTGFVRAWRAVVSPWYGDVCKFYPTCSEYGLEALHHHGAIKGSWLTITRIGRCHPWSLGGYDPVPGSPRDLARQAASSAEQTADGLDLDTPRPLPSSDPMTAAAATRGEL